MKILVTGANGFVGTQLVEYAAKAGHQVVACVRKLSSASHLNALAFHIQSLPYHAADHLEHELAHLKQEHGPFDLVIHNAALTKSTQAAALFETNQHLAVRFARAVQNSRLLAEAGKFVFVSSLAARGPDGFFQPVTSYGKSKLLAERELSSLNLPMIIVRPTAVYGPGDSEFLKLYKVIRLGIAPLLASSSQKLSFVYVKDLARLLVDYTSGQAAGKTITVTDGLIYTPSHFYREIGKSIGKQPISLPIPTLLTMAYAHLNAAAARLVRHNPTLNPEKMKELLSDWSPADKDNPPEGFYFTPLEEGLAQTAAYYKENRLL